MWSFAVPKGPADEFAQRVRAAALKSRPQASEVELTAALKAAESAKDANTAREDEKADQHGPGEDVTVTVQDV